MERDQLVSVQNALYDFIINATKKDAPVHAVQALQGAVVMLIELERIMQIRK